MQRRDLIQTSGSGGLHVAVQRLCKTIVENNGFTTLTTFLTLYALFGDDFRLLAKTRGQTRFFEIFGVGDGKVGVGKSPEKWTFIHGRDHMVRVALTCPKIQRKTGFKGTI